MTRHLKFYGQSDDLFECDGTSHSAGEPDEIGSYDAPVAVTIKAPDGSGLIVFGEYAPEVTSAGAWVIGISNLDDEIPIPPWPMRFENAPGNYSPTLIIEAPDGSVVAQCVTRQSP